MESFRNGQRYPLRFQWDERCILCRNETYRIPLAKFLTKKGWILLFVLATYILESLINIERAARVKFYYNFGIFLVVVFCFLFIIFLNKLFQKGRKRSTSTTLKRLENIYPLLWGKREYFFNSIIQRIFHIHILQRKAMLPATSQPPRPFYPFYMHFRPYPYDIQAGIIVAV